MSTRSYKELGVPVGAQELLDDGRFLIWRRKDETAFFRIEIEMKTPYTKRQMGRQGNSSGDKFWLCQPMRCFTPGGMFQHKFYAETPWSGIAHWHKIEPSHRISMFFAKIVIIWMGKPLQKFPLIAQEWLILDVSQRSVFCFKHSS